jgi:rhamnosyltransferase
VDGGAEAVTASDRNVRTPEEKVAAVVVSYQPDDAFPQRLHAIALQTHATIVVDNSVDAEGRVPRICRDLGCRCVVNGRNVGLAEALNQGVREACAAGATLVVTMDQDSTPTPTMVAELLRTLNAAREAGLPVGLVVPTSIDVATGRRSGVPDGRAEWSEETIGITSGSLIPVTVLCRVGLFRPDYFIDGIDHEFCLRARQYGYKTIRAHRASMYHRLGAPRIRHVLGVSFIPTNHSATRRFYMARNTIWTAKLLLLSETRTVLALAFRLVKNIVLIALLEDQKTRKLSATVAGLVNGLITKPSSVPPLASPGSRSKCCES